MKTPLILLAAGVSALALPACTKKPAPVAPATPPPQAETTAAPEAAATPETAAPEAPPASPQAADNNGGRRRNRDNRQGGGGGGGGQGNFQQRAQERMQQMKTEIGLTDDQAQKIQAIFQQQFASLRGQMQNLSQEDRRAAFEKARSEANTQIESLLTPEQKPKWQQYEAQQEQRRQQRMNGGGGNNR